MHTATKIRSFLIGAVAAITVLPFAAPVAASPAEQTWYVSASAGPGGDGSTARPFGSLAEVEQASSAGDIIRVVPSTEALDGGIQLKPGQTLVGDGDPVRSLAASAPAPLLTNTSGERLDGDAVRLADGATVRNLRITGAYRGAVYGKDVTDVAVAGNDVSRHNTSCAPGFLISEFVAPTNVPGVGIPIVGGLPNGWAAIMIDAEHRKGSATITRNEVRDAACGDGIDVRTWGTASYRVRITRNDVHSLRQGSGFKSLLAIGLQARDTSSLTATVEANTQANLGNPDELNFYAAGANSEGVFINGVGPSTIDVVVSRNHYTNEPGVGGFSANGLELVTMGDGSRVSAVIRDSYFAGSTGDIIEHGALGTNARLDMLLERVTAERTTGHGNTFLLPFNNGDCVLAGSLGAGNDVRLTVRDSVLRDCDNNGLAIGSNVVNGRGPTKNIELTVTDTVITGNRGANLGIRNFTDLDNLTVTVERSDIAGSHSTSGSAVSDFSAEDLGSTRRSVIDLGGGATRSEGGNCLRGGAFAADVVGYTVAAQRTWWGQPGGPGPLNTLTLAGSLDASEPLSSRPAHCSA